MPKILRDLYARKSEIAAKTQMLLKIEGRKNSEKLHSVEKNSLSSAFASINLV